MYKKAYAGLGYTGGIHEEVEAIVDGRGFDPTTGELLPPMSYADARDLLGYAGLVEVQRPPLPAIDPVERLVDQGVYCPADARVAA